MGTGGGLGGGGWVGTPGALITAERGCREMWRGGGWACGESSVRAGARDLWASSLFMSHFKVSHGPGLLT